MFFRDRVTPFEMIKLSCNHLRGFEHELMAQRLFPFRSIDIYWKKYQRLYLAILACIEERMYN